MRLWQLALARMVVSSQPAYDIPAQLLTTDHPIPNDACSPPSRLEMFSLLFKRFNDLPVIVVKGGECDIHDCGDEDDGTSAWEWRVYLLHARPQDEEP